MKKIEIENWTSNQFMKKLVTLDKNEWYPKTTSIASFTSYIPTKINEQSENECTFFMKYAQNNNNNNKRRRR